MKISTTSVPRATAGLKEYLRRAIHWSSTGDAIFPWSAKIGSHVFRVRVNDFPAEQLYTLISGKSEIGDFDDWPKCWERAKTAASAAKANHIVRSRSATTRVVDRA